MVVTSLADGMNLVAKEFVAARGDLGGVLILSEFTGAAQDLDGALIVNPYDIEAIKRAMVAAIHMPAAERAARLRTMRIGVRHNDVHRWARNFLNRLVSAAAVRSGDLALQTPADDRVSGEPVRKLR
jgi:trehalose-6-phosphate synthase